MSGACLSGLSRQLHARVGACVRASRLGALGWTVGEVRVVGQAQGCADAFLRHASLSMPLAQFTGPPVTLRTDFFFSKEYPAPRFYSPQGEKLNVNQEGILHHFGILICRALLRSLLHSASAPSPVCAALTCALSPPSLPFLWARQWSIWTAYLCDVYVVDIEKVVLHPSAHISCAHTYT